MRRTCSASLASVVLLTACGEVIDEDYRGQPYAVVRGRITQANALNVSGHASMAISWNPEHLMAAFVNPAMYDPSDPRYYREVCSETVPELGSCDGVPYIGDISCRVEALVANSLTDTVDVDLQFPLQFEVPVFQLPPPQALYDLTAQGGTGVVGMAHMGAFIDADEDGVYDFGTTEIPPEVNFASSAFQDYLPEPGQPRRAYFIVFLDGEINLDSAEPLFADLLADMPTGFSIWAKEEWVDDNGYRLSASRTILPIDQPIEMVAHPNVLNSGDGCAEFDFRKVHLDSLPAGEVPICSADGLRVYWNSWPTSWNGCWGVSEVFQACLPDASQVPPDWPCAVQ